MELTSNFKDGGVIPKKHTCEGSNQSPPMKWSDVPEGTKSFALICDDPDAPSRDHPAAEPWVHWLIYNISADANLLPEGISPTLNPEEVGGASQGRNSWPEKNIGYRGPMPPPGSGTHRYFFRLFALDDRLVSCSDTIDKTQLLAAIEGHVLGEAQLMGTYERD